MYLFHDDAEGWGRGLGLGVAPPPPLPGAISVTRTHQSTSDPSSTSQHFLFLGALSDHCHTAFRVYTKRISLINRLFLGLDEQPLV